MENINNIIKRQHFASAYVPQTLPFPGVGMVVSMGTAMVALALLVRKTAQAVFDPEYKYESGLIINGKLQMGKYVRHIDDAAELGILFLNNIANVATLGILNYCIVSRDKILPEKDGPFSLKANQTILGLHCLYRTPAPWSHIPVHDDLAKQEA